LTRNKRQLKQVCYLLHFESDGQPVEHYAGICYADRVDARIREHRAARGSQRSANLIQQGYRLTWNQIFGRGSLQLETWLQADHVAIAACDRCKAAKKLAIAQSSA
jgi:hypothetical protein